MGRLEHWIDHKILGTHFDSVALGVLCLKSFKINDWYWENRKRTNDQNLIFDLASISKPFNFFSCYIIDPSFFTEDKLLLVNHQAGLPVGGRLHVDNWKDQIQNYPIKQSKTLYSDYSALRFMLEWQKRHGANENNILKNFSSLVVPWQNITSVHHTIPTGERNGKLIKGDVHDPNAYNLKSYCFHSGLFSNLGGVFQTLINWVQGKKFIEIFIDHFKQYPDVERFRLGWDTVTDPSCSLAGTKASRKTIGFLGFTGTSLWIDLEKMKAICLLTNETRGAWYDRAQLREFRIFVHDELWD